jgi:hypothetical protein
MNLCNSNEKQSAASSSKNVKNLNFESHKMFQKPCLSFSKDLGNRKKKWLQSFESRYLVSKKLRCFRDSKDACINSYELIKCIKIAIKYFLK